MKKIIFISIIASLMLFSCFKVKRIGRLEIDSGRNEICIVSDSVKLCTKIDPNVIIVK